MVILFLTAALAAQTGDLKIKIDGKAGDVAVYPASPLVEARLLAEQCGAGFFMEPKGIAAEARTVRTDAGATVTVKPGIYHLRIRTDAGGSIGASSGIWLANQKIESGKLSEAVVKIGAPGTVKGTWSVDKSALKRGKPLESCTAALVRDGRVWAFAKNPKGGGIEVKGAAPGTYSLVLVELFESFVSVTEDIVVVEGKETAVKVEVKRASLGGIHVQFTDKAGKPTGMPEGALLMDGRGRFALGPSFGDFVGEVEFFGWCGFPAGGGYVLKAEGLERKGITLKSPALKGTGASAAEVYETLKIPLGGGK